jgi:hypothetical protein
MSDTALTTLRNRVASLNQTVRSRSPVAAAVADLSVRGCERLGERATSTQRRRIALLSLVGMMMMVTPAAAQPNCGSGFLQFIGFVRTLSIQAVGMAFIVLILAGVVLKAIPIAGTDRAGNAVLGGVVVALVFLVLAVTLVDLADSAAGGIELSSSCSTGGSGSGG